MGSILKRTAFIGRDSDGYCRLEDWAQTMTSLGPAAEPFHMEFIRDHGTDNVDQVEIDWEDDLRIVHDPQVVPHEIAFQAINFDVDNPPIHGGHLYPRDGR